MLCNILYYVIYYTILQCLHCAIYQVTEIKMLANQMSTLIHEHDKYKSW